MASQNPSNNFDSDDLDQPLNVAMAHVEDTSAFTADDASEYSDSMTTTGSLYSRDSPGIMPQDDSHSPKQTPTDDDTLQALDGATVQVAPDSANHFHITILHIKGNKEYQLEVEASTTVKELAWMVQPQELIPIQMLNLLQHGVVRIFAGDEDDEMSALTLGELGIEDGDRINVVLKGQVAVFPRDQWYEAEDGSIKLGEHARQRFRGLVLQDEESRKESGDPSVDSQV